MIHRPQRPPKQLARSAWALECRCGLLSFGRDKRECWRNSARHDVTMALFFGER